MAAKRDDRHSPAPGRPATIEVDRVDPEHPKRSLPPVMVSTKSLGRAVDDLRTFESHGAPVVSVYWSVPADVGQLKGAVAELKDLVKPVRERASAGDLSREEKMSLLSDADRILELEPLADKLLGRTLAYFLCSAEGLDEAVTVPAGLATRAELDARPYLRPLLAVLDEEQPYAVAIVDRKHGQLYQFSLGVLEASEREEGRALRNPNAAAGDKEYGVHRKAEALARRHYREITQALQELVARDGIDEVVVGGHADAVPAFVEELPSDLRHRVVGTFVIDPHMMTLAAARDAAHRVVEEHERRQAEELVEQAKERVAEGGLGAVGLEWCLAAAYEQAIDVLVAADSAEVPGRVCDRCGWLGLDAEQCPTDGTPTRAVPDVIDEMAIRVIDTSGHVRHVAGDGALGDDLTAALLRFPVPSPGAAGT